MCVSSQMSLDLLKSCRVVIFLRMIHLHSFIEQSLFRVAWEWQHLTLKGHIGWHLICHILLLHLSHELSSGNALCNSFSGGQFFSLIASFVAVIEPPAEIVTFHHSCVSNVQSCSSGRDAYCGLDKLNTQESWHVYRELMCEAVQASQNNTVWVNVLVDV